MENKISSLNNRIEENLNLHEKNLDQSENRQTNYNKQFMIDLTHTKKLTIRVQTTNN